MDLISNVYVAYTQYVTLKSLSKMCTLRIRNVCEESIMHLQQGCCELT